MPIVLPVRTYSRKRVRRFIDAWAGLALGWTSSGAAASPTRRVHQSDGGDPRPDLPYLSYTRLAGPEPLSGAQDDEWIGDVPQSAAVVVTASAAGEATTLSINSARFSRTMLVGETTEDQRDALIELIAASVEPVTCTASGANGISLVPEYPGDLQRIAAVEGCTLTVVEAIRSVVYGQRVWRYRMQLHAGSDTSDPSSGWIDIDQCADALQTVLWSAQLTPIATSLGVTRLGPRYVPQRASVQSGGRIEQRCFFDVNLVLGTYYVTSTEPIAIDDVAPPAIVLL